MSKTKEKAPTNSNFTRQLTRIYENLKYWCFRSIQSTSWLFENSEPDSYDKNDMIEKVNDLIRLHKAIQENLKTAWFSEKKKFLPWYLINGLECTVENILISLNTLFELNMKWKRCNISKTFSWKKEKLSPLKQFIW